MTDRVAIDIIKGYFYQFDYSIVQILSLTNDTDTITIEGIEDIDISTATEETAIQCKYYAKTEYNHSVIAEPIRLMLNHFAEYKKGNATKITYRLRGYYKSGHHKLIVPVDLQFLKTHFLTYSRTINKNKITYEHHNDLGLSDPDLSEFLCNLIIDINALDFESQFKDLISKLKAQYACSEFMAENFYYNNALRIIKELSIKKQAQSRTISRATFLNLINTSQILFNEWFIQRRGEKAHFSNLRKEYFTSLNVSSFERLFIFESNPSLYSRSELKELLFVISKKWSKITRREPKPFCPYVYIHNIDDRELIELKKELASEDFICIDGYDFNGADFNPSSITKKADYSNQIKLKFINEVKYIDDILSVAKGTKQVYQFYFEKPFYDNDQASIRHIKIQIGKLDNIKNII
jgi:hypothetical protein